MYIYVYIYLNNFLCSKTNKYTKDGVIKWVCNIIIYLYVYIVNLLYIVLFIYLYLTMNKQ